MEDLVWLENEVEMLKLCYRNILTNLTFLLLIVDLCRYRQR
jgi:hypothetical protein